VEEVNPIWILIAFIVIGTVAVYWRCWRRRPRWRATKHTIESMEAEDGR
jgi:hypothetical protein